MTERKINIIFAMMFTIWITLFVATIITTNPDTRTIDGEMTGKIYHKDGDFTSMEITTLDGNIWVVDDIVAPLGATCKVTFDTQGTSKVEDDVITSISCKIKQGQETIPFFTIFGRQCAIAYTCAPD